VLKADSCTLRVEHSSRLCCWYYGKAAVNLYFDIHCKATIRQITS